MCSEPNCGVPKGLNRRPEGNGVWQGASFGQSSQPAPSCPAQSTAPCMKADAKCWHPGNPLLRVSAVAKRRKRSEWAPSTDVRTRALKIK